MLEFNFNSEEREGEFCLGGMTGTNVEALRLEKVIKAISAKKEKHKEVIPRYFSVCWQNVGIDVASLFAVYVITLKIVSSYFSYWLFKTIKLTSSVPRNV